MNLNNNLIQLRDQFGGEIRGNSLVTICPSCNKEKHFVIYDNPWGLYSICFRCGYRLRNYKLSSESSSNNIKSKLLKKKLVPITTLPEVFTIDDPEFKPALNYLLSRGVTEQQIRLYNLGLGKAGIWANRVIFYCLDELGLPVFVGGRSIDPNCRLRYYYPPGSPKSEVLFNLEYIPISEKSVVLVEGVFDVLCSHIPNSVAIFGKTLSSTQRSLIISRFNKVIVWLDNPIKDPDTLPKSHKLCYDLLYEIPEVYLLIQRFGDDPGTCPNPSFELANSVIKYTSKTWINYKISQFGGVEFV